MWYVNDILLYLAMEKQGTTVEVNLDPIQQHHFPWPRKCHVYDKSTSFAQFAYFGQETGSKANWTQSKLTLKTGGEIMS